MSSLTVQEVVSRLPDFLEAFIYDNASERQEAIEAAAKLAASVWSSFLDPEMCTEDQRRVLFDKHVIMTDLTLPKTLPSKNDQDTFYQLLVKTVKTTLRQMGAGVGPGKHYCELSLETNYGPKGKLSDIWDRANFSQGDEWEQSLLPRKSSIDIFLQDTWDSGDVTVRVDLSGPHY